MDIVWLLAIASLSNIACFFIGAKVGQTVSKGETIETPTVNPLEVYRKHQAQKEAEREKNMYDTILRNIDNYDGTGYGQEEVR
jgi:hypothetical protein